MPSKVYPPLSASYGFIQGHNVKTYEIFSQRLIGVIGRSDRSKIVSMTSHKYVSPYGTPVTGSKIINQTSENYYDDSLFAEGGVKIFNSSGSATYSTATITILSGTSWNSNQYIQLRLYDTNVSPSVTQPYAALGTSPADLTAMSGTAGGHYDDPEFLTFTAPETDPAGFPWPDGLGGGMRYHGMLVPDATSLNYSGARPFFNLTGSVIQYADLTSGTESEKYALIAAHQNITGANLIALDLYQRISQSLNNPLSPFSTLPLHVGISQIAPSGSGVTGSYIPYPGNVITISVTSQGKNTNPLFNTNSLGIAQSPWLTGSMMRFNIGLTSSFNTENIKVSTAPAGYAPISFSSNVGLPAWSESSGSLKFLPQYNLERNNFGYSDQQTFTPFVDVTSLLGFSEGSSSGEKLHVDMVDYVHTYTTDAAGQLKVVIESDRQTITDPATGLQVEVGHSTGAGGINSRGTSSPAPYQRTYNCDDSGRIRASPDVRSGMAGGGSPPAPGRHVQMPGFFSMPFTGSANVLHLGEYFLKNQFLSGSELNYGTKDSPDYRYTENLRYTNEIYDIDNLTGQMYTDKSLFDTNGVIEPLDIRKKITGDHLCIGDFYDPIHNTLKGTVQSTDRVLTHLGITQKIGETYDVAKDRRVTPFEFIDKAVDIYSLALSVPKLQVTVPKTYILSFSNYFDTVPGGVNESIYDFMRSAGIGPLVLYFNDSGQKIPLGNLKVVRPSDTGTPADYAAGEVPTGAKIGGGQWTRNAMAEATSQAINSSSMGTWVTASYARELNGAIGNSDQVFITPLSSSANPSGGWNTSVYIYNPMAIPHWPPEGTLDHPGAFNNWVLTSSPRKKSIGGGWCDYSPYLNLTDLTANPDPFF